MTSIYFLGLSTLTIIVAFIILDKIKKYGRNSNHPPGNNGWPILGETLEFSSNPAKFVRDRMMKHSSDIFQTSFIGHKVVFFCGPSGNKFIYSNETKFTNWLPQCVARAFSLKNANDTSTTRRFFMEHLHKFFRLESIQDCVGLMHSRANKHIEKHWVPYNEVKVQPLSKNFTLSNAVHLLISSNEDLAKEIAEPFYTLAERILSVPVNLPGTSYNQALKASKIVKDKLMDVMTVKRAEILTIKEDKVDIEIVGKELLSKLMIASYEGDINSIDDEELAGLMIGLLFAGFHTTSTLITFILDFLARYTDVYAKVLQEQMEIAQSKRKGELLNWKDIQRMKYTWNVACETMRLMPPGVGGFREAITDISYAGYTVPKGAKVHWNVYTTHMDPTYFPNPEKFDPTRFEKALPPRAFVPFGGGLHMCCGRELARISTLVYIHNVVTRFTLSKANPNEKIIYKPDAYPVDGLRMNFHSHEIAI